VVGGRETVTAAGGREEKNTSFKRCGPKGCTKKLERKNWRNHKQDSDYYSDPCSPADIGRSLMCGK